MQQDFYRRLARIETVEAARCAESMEILQKAYDNACAQKDTEDAAYFARQIRDKLLDESDKQLSLDRLGLDTSNVLGFLASLGRVFGGE